MAPTSKSTGSAAKATSAKATKAAGSSASKATKSATNAAAKVEKAPAKAAKRATKAATKAPAGRVIPALAKRASADPNRKPPPKRKGPLDKFLLGQLQALETERETYLHQAESLRAEADSLVAEREPGDVQFDEESGEGDTLAVERERDLTLSAQAANSVVEIDIAIAKIKDGTYGVCEECYSPIPKERLKALPFAALCVQCKSAGFTPRR